MGKTTFESVPKKKRLDHFRTDVQMSRLQRRKNRNVLNFLGKKKSANAKTSAVSYPSSSKEFNSSRSSKQDFTGCQLRAAKGQTHIRYARAILAVYSLPRIIVEAQSIVPDLGWKVHGIAASWS
jgi:hypothetical protein